MGERLKGKVAIVTGAGSVGRGVGNGRATAIVFAREGAKIVAVDINVDSANETKRLVEETGGQALVIQADVSRSADCQKVIEKCIQSFGRLDILYNNVGITASGGLNRGHARCSKYGRHNLSGGAKWSNVRGV